MKSRFPFPDDLNDWNEYREMVHWFNPTVLLQTAKRVIDSTQFGKYADRRLIHAALDRPINRWTLLKECFGGKKGVCRRRKKPEVWVDYVADLGDGFNSTYAVAYLIGQQELKIGNDKLPRADCLIMGGDEVYPYASAEDYRQRMQRAYKAAFPKTKLPGGDRPPVYLIPGNHDWYDGLTLFLAKFCRGRKTPLGSWTASQRRSYFAAHLGDNWWIWGFDSQLGEDVDQPQADYFVTVARKMAPNAKIIICASVPTWLKANLNAKNKEEQAKFYKGLDYIAGIVRDECPNAKVPLVLAGDLHHYTRYKDKESGTHFINSGGGGAFLHPTHYSVDEVIPLIWAGAKQTLHIGIDAADGKTNAIYPKPEDSLRLARGNILFWKTNFGFCVLVLGPLYIVCGLLMLWWRGYGATGGDGPFWSRLGTQIIHLLLTPSFLFVLIPLFIGLYQSADIRPEFPGWLSKLISRIRARKACRKVRRKYVRYLRRLRSLKSKSSNKRLKLLRNLENFWSFVTSRRFHAAGLHCLAQLTTILVGTALVSLAVVGWKTVALFGEILYFFGLLVGMLPFAIIGGFIWGIYLRIVSRLWGDEGNSAFSALRLEEYKNFVRLRIEGDKIKVYPIGLDEVPKREEWRTNKKYGHGDQNEPWIIPTKDPKDIGQRYIEQPFDIDINDIAPIKAISAT